MKELQRRLQGGKWIYPRRPRTELSSPQDETQCLFGNIGAVCTPHYSYEHRLREKIADSSPAATSEHTRTSSACIRQLLVTGVTVVLTELQARFYILRGVQREGQHTVDILGPRAVLLSCLLPQPRGSPSA